MDRNRWRTEVARDSFNERRTNLNWSFTRCCLVEREVELGFSSQQHFIERYIFRV